MSKSKTVSETDLKKIKSPIFLIEDQPGHCVLPKLPNKEYLDIIPGEKIPIVKGMKKKPLYVYKVNKTNFDKMLKSCSGKISGTLRISDRGVISIVPEPLVFNPLRENSSRTNTSDLYSKFRNSFIENFPEVTSTTSTIRRNSPSTNRRNSPSTSSTTSRINTSDLYNKLRNSIRESSKARDSSANSRSRRNSSPTKTERKTQRRKSTSRKGKNSRTRRNSPSTRTKRKTTGRNNYVSKMSTDKEYVYKNGSFSFERTHNDPKIKCKKESQFKNKKITCPDDTFWCPSLKNPYGCEGEWSCNVKSKEERKVAPNTCMNIDTINSFYA